MTSLEVNYGNQRAFNFAAGDGAVSLLIIPNDSIVFAYPRLLSNVLSLFHRHYIRVKCFQPL